MVPMRKFIRIQEYIFAERKKKRKKRKKEKKEIKKERKKLRTDNSTILKKMLTQCFKIAFYLCHFGKGLMLSLRQSAEIHDSDDYSKIYQWIPFTMSQIYFI